MSDTKNENNLNKKLAQKQLCDLGILFIIFLVLFITVQFANLEIKNLAFVFILLFCVNILVFEITRKIFRRNISRHIIDKLNAADDDAKKIENTANTQKENISTSFSKISNAKNLIENLKNCMDEMYSLVENTREKASKSLEFTNTEHMAVKANIEKMFTIRHKIQTIAELILELSEFIQSISSTIGVVEDIAEQTNLLALNAAVEAARAGEHGKGFAVVAGEIRKLADESKQATTKITSLITDIQQTTNSTVMATEEGTKEIESGIDLAHSIGSNIEQLIGHMNEITRDMEEIINSSKKISQGTKNTDSFMDDLDSTLKDNYKITEENFKNIENLKTISRKFKDTLSED